MFGILFAAQSASAQQNMLVVGDNGSVNVVSVSSVDYATFSASDKWFTITNDGVQGATTNLISADCTVKLSADSEVKSLSVTPEIGVCYSKDKKVPSITDETVSLGSELKSYTFTLKSLVSGTDYYFRPYVKLSNAVFYGEVATAKTLGTKPVDNSKTINGHKFVDLGLPSGLLWAETNIGAATAADYGNYYYAWGETTTKTDYSWSTYKYGTSYDNMTKYNSTDGKTVLDKEDDAAYVNWGSSCRMPTHDEFTELRNSDNCTWTWTSQTTSSGSSIKGYKVTSVKNGNSIFLPASGSRYGEYFYCHGDDGYYCSGSLYPYYSDRAYYLYFNSGCQYGHFNDRYVGYAVRPVAEQ